MNTTKQQAQPTPDIMRTARWAAELVRTAEYAISYHERKGSPLTPRQRQEAREGAEREVAELLARESTAPDLLAALMMLVGPDGDIFSGKAHAAAHAAIAKATGNP